MNAITFQKATGMRTPYISGSLSAKYGPVKTEIFISSSRACCEGVVLEREPDRRVKRLHLRRGVGDVHGVLVAALGTSSGFPSRDLRAASCGRG